MSYDSKGSLEQADFFQGGWQAAGMKSGVWAYIRRFGKERMCFYDREESTCLYFLVEERRPCIRLSPGREKGHICPWAGKLLNEDSLLRLTSAVNCEVREDSLVMVLPAERFIQVMDKDGRRAREVMGPWLLNTPVVPSFKMHHQCP